MRLIDIEWNPLLRKWTNFWLADDESEITAGFDPDSAIGSTIIVISTQSTWMKNTQGNWQKVGTTEVAE